MERTLFLAVCSIGYIVLVLQLYTANGQDIQGVVNYTPAGFTLHITSWKSTLGFVDLVAHVDLKNKIAEPTDLLPDYLWAWWKNSP